MFRIYFNQYYSITYFEFDLLRLTIFEGIRDTFAELEVEAFIAKRLVNINYLSKFSRIGI